MFSGFSNELVTFYKQLSQNNDRVWFNGHKDIYKKEVLAPAIAFVETMGMRLQAIAPNIIADTRMNGAGSIFRIYRDIRFSKDKSPYKTYLGIHFWEGAGKKTENTGFYFHLQPPNLMLAAGMHGFTKPVLASYREAVVDPELGAALRDAVEMVTSREGYEVGGQHYKRTPRGYEDHKENEYLLHSGLHVSTEMEIPTEFFSADFIDYCFEHFNHMSSIHQWLVPIVAASAA
jgi:uncharacterized protein (TIGR02453 family)